MTLIRMIPWLFSATTAFCFALMVRKAGRNWFQWGTLGGAGSLFITTAILGAAEAAFIPISHGAYVIFWTKVTLAAILLNVLPGWLITVGMHRQHLALLKTAKGLLTRVHSGPTSQKSSSGGSSLESDQRKAKASPARTVSYNKMA